MAEHAGRELHSALDVLWPTLSTDQRAELLAYAGDCASDGTDGFYGSIQLHLLRSQLEASNMPGVEQLLRGLWLDVIGYLPIEFMLAKGMPEGSSLKAMDLLFAAESSAKCEDARQLLEATIRRSLLGACPEAKTLGLAKLRRWFESHRDELQVDPAYAEALRQWWGLPDPVPPLLVRK